MPRNPNLYIIDDGTLDTVVACSACNWEGRYNPDIPIGDPSGHCRHSAALEMAADDHPDCQAEASGS
jgi:hypothetical protein